MVATRQWSLWTHFQTVWMSCDHVISSWRKDGKGWYRELSNLLKTIAAVCWSFIRRQSGPDLAWIWWVMTVNTITYWRSPLSLQQEGSLSIPNSYVQIQSNYHSWNSSSFGIGSLLSAKIQITKLSRPNAHTKTFTLLYMDKMHFQQIWDANLQGNYEEHDLY